MKKFLALSLSDVVFIMLINVKIPTIVVSLKSNLNEFLKMVLICLCILVQILTMFRYVDMTVH